MAGESDLERKIETARLAVQNASAWVSGTVKLSSQNLHMFYLNKANDAHFLNLSTATSTQLDVLTAACDAATFGRADEDVLDESYRKARKMDTEKFSSKFSLEASHILPTVLPRLLVGFGKNDGREVEAELYKLNIYGEGGFFRAHKDTPRSSKMFGSLVVVFPTPHTGGHLVLRKNGEEFTFKSDQLPSSRDEIAYIAFFSDVEHEVLPVTSGHRITLTYNLYHADSDKSTKTSRLNLDNHDITPLKNALSDLVNDPKFMPNGGYIGFGLRYDYPVVPNKTRFSEFLDLLKGEDLMVQKACEALGLEVSIRGALDEANSYERTHQALVDHAVDLSARSQVDVEEGDGSWAVIINGAERVAQVGPGAGDWNLKEDKDREHVLWVTPLEEDGGYKMDYIAYGNQAELEYRYVRPCLVAKLRR
ncbi:hypothetical protein PM082_021847 [Marasmius tenuissimus]|nr:hypothetical protein PM082_021847 [Marasmius tenuissimus]